MKERSGTLIEGRSTIERHFFVVSCTPLGGDRQKEARTELTERRVLFALTPRGGEKGKIDSVPTYL